MPKWQASNSLQWSKHIIQFRLFPRLCSILAITPFFLPVEKVVYYMGHVLGNMDLLFYIFYNNQKSGSPQKSVYTAEYIELKIIKNKFGFEIAFSY